MSTNEKPKRVRVTVDLTPDEHDELGRRLLQIALALRLRRVTTQTFGQELIGLALDEPDVFERLVERIGHTGR